MRLSIDQLSSVWGPPRSLAHSPSRVYRRICYDTRRVIHPSRAIFVALSGKYHNGHDYIDLAVEQGIQVFLLSDTSKADNLSGNTVYLVPDVLRALQDLARTHRSLHHIPTIGITGSNGKTIIKDWLTQLLAPHYHLCSSPGSYNSQLGVALSVLEIEPEHELGIFEAGISMPGEMQRLARVIDPQITILSNIGDAHDAGFSSRNEKLSEKMLLAASGTLLVYCGDHEVIHRAAVARDDLQTHCWTLTGQADADVSFQLVDTSLIMTYQGERYEYPLTMLDDASVENLCHCLALICVHNPALLQDQLPISALRRVDNRLQIHSLPGESVIIDDSYNNDLAGLESALSVLQAHSSQRDKIVVISRPQQQQNDTQLVPSLLQLINYTQPQVLLTLGLPELASALGDRSDLEHHDFDQVDSLQQHLLRLDMRHCAILIKGSRDLTLEKLVQRLQYAVHRTHLRIDLAAISHNLGIVSSYLDPSTRLMAVIKASAYGSGPQIAQHLSHMQVDRFAVAYIGEAVELRQAGITRPIMVMYTEASQYHIAANEQLDLQINNIAELRELCRYADQTHLQRSLYIHLHINTGMNRLGLSPSDCPQAIELLRQTADVKLAGVMTHLAAAGSPEHDEFTESQVDQCLEAADLLRVGLGRSPLIHVLNSEGILRHSELQQDMVRAGLVLYGYGNHPQLISAHSLRSQIVHLQDLYPGDTVSYDRSYVIDKPSKIATVCCGYADGLPRALDSSQHHLLLHDTPVRIVGKICMDFCMIDVTQVSDVSLGDEVTIFGAQNPLTSLASACQTIPYEILSKISTRVKRIYHYDSQ